jgi:hypothetical protein
MTVEKIDIINLAEISFNIVKEFRAKEQIQIQDAFDNGQELYKSKRLRNR